LDEKPVTLTGKFPIRHLFQTGKKFGKKPLQIISKRNSLGFNRYLYCPDKTCKNSVQRNKVKRVLRAHIHEIHPQLKIGYDLGFITGFAFTEIVFTERKSILLNLLKNNHP
jgi:ribonuclease P protein component